MPNTAQHAATRCPDRDVLVAFSCGKLPDRELESIGAHLSSCETCLAFLDSQTAPENGRSILGQAAVAIAQKDSEKSALLDTALELIRGDSEFQRMKARAKAIEFVEDRETADFVPRPPAVPKLADEVLPERIGRYFVLKKLGRGASPMCIWPGIPSRTAWLRSRCLVPTS